MFRPERTRPYALLCAFTLLIAVLCSYPVAEIGINDDWSYVRSVKLMADTGHLHYIGWASAMLGWLVPFGALFVKLFGFSFTAVRATSLVLAACTAFFLQRAMVRCGLREGNASLLTLMLALSPVYVPLASTFMTDMAGLFVAVVCFYCCVRALQADREATATWWFVLACVLDALGGTARQTAWFGLLLMVPSTAFLLRKRRLPWALCGLVWLACLAFVYGSMRWFDHQPYSLREAVVAGYLDRDLLLGFADHVLRAGLAFVLLLSPLLLVLLPAIQFRHRRVIAWGAALGGLTLLLVGLAVHRHALGAWLAPFDGSLFTERGLEDMPEIGDRRVMLDMPVRAALTLLTVISLFAAGAFTLAPKRNPRQALVTASTPGRAGDLTLRQLGVLLGPFLVGYLLLTLHRAMFARLYDRYLVLVLWIPALFLCRRYQAQVARQLPPLMVAMVAGMGLFSVAANHDVFSEQRARLRAAEKLQQAGIGRDQMFAGWEYDGWTQVDHTGFVNSAYMNLPTGFSRTRPIPLRMKTAPCDNGWARDFPAIQAQYALSYDNISCDGPSQFAPVPYLSWLPPYHAEIYVQRVRERTY